MRSRRALLWISLGIAMLALGALDAVVPTLLRGFSLPEETVASLAPQITTVVAGIGFLVLLVGIVVMVGAVRRGVQWAPYVHALQALAFEHGRRVIEEEGALSMAMVRDGQRMDVRLEAGRLVLRSAIPARQSLAFCRPGHPPEGPPPTWRPVGVMERWELHAELPAMARPLLSEVALLAVLDRYFLYEPSERITHVLRGLIIEEALPPPEAVEARVRAAVDLAHTLKRFNG